MSPRELTVGDLAALVARGVRLDAARVTATGIVVRVRSACRAAEDAGARAARHVCGDDAIARHVLGVLIDVEGDGEVAPLEADEPCPDCDGRGWWETVEGHQLPCLTCDERGLVARDATYHACEESYESIDAVIEASREVAS